MAADIPTAHKIKTGEDVRQARAVLGTRLGMGRPMAMAQLARLLRLQGRDPGQSVRDWERGKTPVSGPVCVAIEAMLAGFIPLTED